MLRVNDERLPPSEEEWTRTLVERLSVFVDIWKPYQGTELAGAQQFLNKLLEIYEADFKPGEIFEQHPVKVPAPARSSQGSLFPTEAVTFTTKRMDLYLPRVCVWEMKAPSEKDLS